MVPSTKQKEEKKFKKSLFQVYEFYVISLYYCLTVSFNWSVFQVERNKTYHDVLISMFEIYHQNESVSFSHVIISSPLFNLTNLFNL